jgi:hypothetical protein
MLFVPVVSALLLLVVTGSALGWNEPDDFRGVPWGASLQEARTLLESKGEEPDCRIDRCNVPGSIGPTRLLIEYIFIENKFTLAMLTFLPSQYEMLHTIFSDRYGPPTWIEDEEVRTGMGVAYTNQVATWAGDRVVIELERYGSTINYGRAMISLKEFLDKEREETESAIKQGKADL